MYFKKPLILVLCLCGFLFSESLSSYQKACSSLDKLGEVRFKFSIKSPAELLNLTNEISLDKITTNEVIAYANQEEFEAFRKYNYEYEVLPYNDPVDEPNQMSDYANVTFPNFDWTKYPTYSGYLKIMEDLEKTYSDKVKLHQIGTSVRNRKLLVLNVSSNVGTKGNKPKFLMNAGIHGNELVPIMNMMRLVDWLCSKYSSDARAKRILDSIDMWVSPMLNPDGTYKGGNNASVVSNAQRYNNNRVDLNRNWARLPGAGQTPREEKETTAFLKYEKSHIWAMGIGWHSGTEGISYPWSSFGRAHPDKAWYEYVGDLYANQAQADGPNGFFDDIHNGNGQGYYHLYPAKGTAKDAICFYQNTRTNCHESSTTKNMPASRLNNYWNYHFKATLKYVQEALHGIRGVVKDSDTKKALPAKVWVEGHDKNQDRSYIFADTTNNVGNYHRLIIAGTYNLTFSCEAYNCQSKTVRNIQVRNGRATFVDVELDCDISPIGQSVKLTNNAISIKKTNKGIEFTCGNKNIVGASIYNVKGKVVASLSTRPGMNRFVWNGKGNNNTAVSNGCYLVTLQTTKGQLTKRFNFAH